MPVSPVRCMIPAPSKEPNPKKLATNDAREGRRKWGGCVTTMKKENPEVLFLW